MKIKSEFLAATLAVVLCLSGNLLAKAYSGGDGTAGNPYQIANVDDFQRLSNTPTDWNSSFIVTADIDLASLPFTQTPIAGDTSTTISGFQGTQFTGTFDGRKYIISNLTVTAPTKDYIGLFGYVGSSGRILNVSIEHATLSGRHCAGGLVGFNSGTLTACYVTGSVSGAGNSVGGLVGANSSGMITTCYATDSVSGTSLVGGLVGMNSSGVITTCYAAGPVSGTSFTGGLSGRNDSGSISGCFWDMETSGQPTSAGGVGKTTEEMMTLSTFTDAGWDFTDTDGDMADWQMGSREYPVLARDPAVIRYSGGNGMTVNPYQIANAADFQLLFTTPTDWNSAFILTADIDFGGAAITPVGNSSTKFTGIFDGNGHIISNAVIHLPDNYYVGLFGYVGSSGQIRNLGVEGVNLLGHSYVGGLVGYNEGTLTGCYATGSVTSIWSYVGGLVAWNEGTLTSCYATGPVVGTGYVGGLVGVHYTGTLTACYSASSVSWGPWMNNYFIGGLVPFNYNGSLSGCFWDVQTSGQSGSDGGKGLTTSQMKSITTYQYAGWADKGWENTGGVPIPQPLPVPLSGSGSETDPYQIHTAEEFALLSGHSGILNKHIVLMADLDLSTVTLYPIGPFTGVFDGNDHMLSNAVINQPASGYIGLFGYVGSGGQIRNLGVENVNMTGNNHVGGLAACNSSGSITNCYETGSVVTGNDYVGALVGLNGGTLTTCYATGSVSGTGNSVGGLAGANRGGTLSHCYASGSVTGDIHTGGLVGWNDGMLAVCYAAGSVVGDFRVGGLVGMNEVNGTLTGCYASGSVAGNNYFGGLAGYNMGATTSCFWDIQTSGQPTSAGGTGNTTAQMKTLSTFTSAGWDFVDVWVIGQNQTYPYLRTQPSADLNSDGVVNMVDFAIFAGQWLEGV
jgi:hypothetical protein